MVERLLETQKVVSPILTPETNTPSPYPNEFIGYCPRCGTMLQEIETTPEGVQTMTGQPHNYVDICLDCRLDAWEKAGSFGRDENEISALAARYMDEWRSKGKAAMLLRARHMGDEEEA